MILNSGSPAALRSGEPMALRWAYIVLCAVLIALFIGFFVKPVDETATEQWALRPASHPKIHDAL